MKERRFEKKLIRGLACAVFWLAVWVAASALIGRDVVLPMPHKVLFRLADLVATGDFWLACLRSLLGVFLGFLAGVTAGTLAAAASHRFAAVSTLLSPALATVKATPVASFIILLLFLVRRTAVPPVAAALMVLPVVFSHVKNALSSLPKDLGEVCEIFRFSRKKKIRFYYLPHILPHFRAACRSAIGLSWKAGIAAEVICTPGGTIGTNLYYAKNYLATEDMLAWTVTVILFSFLIEKAVIRLIFSRRGEGETV